MPDSRERNILIMADDDQDDFLLVRDAFDECGVKVTLHLLQEGDELLDYLRRRGQYADAARYPFPGLILLDLNMPGRGGRKILAEIKDDPKLKTIPVLILTTSDREEDIRECYRLGANSFIVKPASFDALVETVRTIHDYWFTLSSLPHRWPE